MYDVNGRYGKNIGFPYWSQIRPDTVLKGDKWKNREEKQAPADYEVLFNLWRNACQIGPVNQLAARTRLAPWQQLRRYVIRVSIIAHPGILVDRKYFNCINQPRRTATKWTAICCILAGLSFSTKWDMIDVCKRTYCRQRRQSRSWRLSWLRPLANTNSRLQVSMIYNQTPSFSFLDIFHVVKWNIVVMTFIRTTYC